MTGARVCFCEQLLTEIRNRNAGVHGAVVAGEGVFCVGVLRISRCSGAKNGNG